MWYYAHDGQQHGPMSLEQLADLLRSARIPRDVLVWTQGMPQWLPPMSVTEFASLQVPAPVTPLAYEVPLHLQPGAEPRYAGFWIRVGAYIIDMLVLLIPNLLISVLVELGFTGQVTFDSGRSDVELVDNVLTIVVDWLYFSLMESSTLQASLGKMACGLKVIDAGGSALSFGRASGRYFAKILSAIILCVGFMMAGWTQRKQGLHDMVAATYVVYR